MLALLQIYWLSIAASAALGGGLALLGAQLAARDRAMQTMCVGQGAMLGVLLGIGLNQVLHDSEGEAVVLPFAFALATAAVTYLASERFVARMSASKNTHFTAVFATLLAGGYLVSALFPALENHMAQKYFGDLATMSESGATGVLVLGCVLIGTLMAFRRHITRDSFAMAIMGARRTPTGLVFAIGTLIVLCFSIQVVGFLFTVACLFLPTSALSFQRKVGLNRHLLACLATAVFACCAGFVATLWMTRLPTVPAIIIVMGVSTLGSNILSRRLL